MRHSKDSAYLFAKGYIKSIRDTVGIDEDQIDKEELEKAKKDKSDNDKPEKDTLIKQNAILLNDKKNNHLADSIKGKRQH